MKKSMKRQIIIVFIGLVVLMVAIALFVSNHFLESYYVTDKQKNLETVYTELNSAASTGSLTDTKNLSSLSKQVEIGNFSFYVNISETDMILSATPDEMKKQELKLQLDGYLLGRIQRGMKCLKQTSDYAIYNSTDVRSGERYLEMWGHLSDGSTFIIRSPMQSIRNIANLTNRFFAHIMIVLIILGGVFVWIFAKKLSNPIMELAAISARMANLDFDVRYESGGQNEIGVLGENFNVMSEKLEKTISELKTANYELQKDIEQKDKAEKQRAEFVGNVSHELKTPIALIQGYAEGLKEGIVDDPESRSYYCDVIMDEANKMNQLVRSLLTLNQMETGASDVSYSRFDVLELIKGVVQSSDIMIRQNEVTVKIHEENPVPVWADEFKVEQVFRNYFDNAVHYAQGEKIVDIRVTEDSEQGKVRITVFNTGDKIPEEDLERLWDKFYKVDKARTREYGGHGIGLSIVKAVMESFHCDYGVKNYENGVAFWFELEAK